MKKKAFLILFALSHISLSASSQPVQKAEYTKEDLGKYLSVNTKYPVEAMRDNIQGDVVFSFTINKNGIFENLALIQSPDVSLLNSSRTSMSSLDGEWKPALINSVPADMKYQIVFRFRIFIENKPSDYKEQSRKLFEKQKYEKALKALDSGIEDNKYDYDLYDLRSKVKEALGDSEGAKMDENTSYNLKDLIMTIVDVNVVRKSAPLGVTKTVTVSQ